MHEVEEVFARLDTLVGGPARTNAQIRRDYHGSTIPHLGLTLPTQRQALKQGYSFSHLPAKQQVKRWDRVWRDAKWFETMSQSAIWLSALRDTADLLACWPTAKGWITRCDNWAHSDLLSSAYSRMLEADNDRSKVYPTLTKWNASKNPWHRRQSIVSLIYYHSPNRTPPKPREVLPLVETLLHDDDVYVQKGVGWTLRESYNAFPKQAGPFIDKHATALSSIAYSAATEKHPKAHKEQLKAKRKAARQAARK
ncbi:DNA alkylation repair protein [Phycisphaeraceae bacterium D3-23]